MAWIKSRILIPACICLLTLATSQCNHEDSREISSTLTVLVDADEWLMRPAPKRAVQYLMFLELARPNERGELEGRLAQSWEQTPGSLEWTIHLRKDVRWHDGVPVTASDIKFTVDLFHNPDVLASTSNTSLSDIESVEVLDDQTVIMKYKPSSVWRTYGIRATSTCFIRSTCWRIWIRRRLPNGNSGNIQWVMGHFATSDTLPGP